MTRLDKETTDKVYPGFYFTSEGTYTRYVSSVGSSQRCLRQHITTRHRSGYHLGFILDSMSHSYTGRFYFCFIEVIEICEIERVIRKV